MVDVPMTAAVMGPPSTLAYELITTGRLVHEADPILAAHVANTTAVLTDRGMDTGLNPVFTAANVDGHSLDGDGDVVLEVMNASVASINVTIQTGGTLVGKAVADTVVAIAAGERRHIGRFRSDLYNQPSGADVGRVLVDFSAVASVTVAALGV